MCSVLRALPLPTVELGLRAHSSPCLSLCPKHTDTLCNNSAKAGTAMGLFTVVDRHRSVIIGGGRQTDKGKQREKIRTGRNKRSAFYSDPLHRTGLAMLPRFQNMKGDKE